MFTCEFYEIFKSTCFAEHLSWLLLFILILPLWFLLNKTFGFSDVFREDGSKGNHCVKSICIRSYSGPHLPAFGLNTERYRVSICVHSERGKIRTRITSNTDTFYSVTFERNGSRNATQGEIHFMIHLAVYLFYWLVLLNDWIFFVWLNMSTFLVKISQLVLVITCLGGRFGINCPSAFLKILKFPE